MRSRLPTYGLLLLFAALGAIVVFAVYEGGSDGVEIARIDTAAVETGALLETEEPAPNFEKETLDGGTFRMDEQDGRIVVVNFWATWCAPCRVEIPDLIEMQSALGEENVRFVGISLDHESNEIIRSFVEETGINYPVLVDDGSISEMFGGVYALPTTFVIDREGVIRFRKSGIVTRETLGPLIEGLPG